MADSWTNFGVSPDKVTVTGIPVRNLPQPGDAQRDVVLKEVNLNPEQITFVMSGGSDGLKDYPTAIKSLANQFKTPIQIVAICGKNEKAKAQLEQLKNSLPPHVTLKPMGFIPNKQLIDLVSVADLYITKAGGLSPTEGALLMRPLVLINEYGGHEAENAEFFKKTQMAEVVDSSAHLGKKAEEVLANPALIKKMMEYQREYRNSINLDSLTQWATKKNAQESIRFDLGLKSGTAVEASPALVKLEKEFPGDVEVLLSYGKSKDGTYFGDGKESNPFGHIAIRIGDSVYTVNHMAERGSEPYVIHKLSLNEYLYSTKEYYKNEEFTGMQGQAYAKDTISIRIDGVSKDSMRKMVDEIKNIEQRWREGSMSYQFKFCNCANITLDILKAGGIVTAGKVFNNKYKMPLDVFDAAVKAIEGRTDLNSSLIQYGHVKSSKNLYKSAGFPLSIYQIKRAFLDIFKKGRDKFEKRIDARLIVDKDSSKVRFEKATPKASSGAALRCEKIFL